MNFKFFVLYTLFFLLFSSDISVAQEVKIAPKNEFRGVWIATVANIDWPLDKTDSISKQKADFIAILDTYKKLHFNAVIVQIRTAGDAFYETKLAPWSKYLSGKEGLAPTPYYDPLAWMIAEAHQRGFEFHAWLNPYRATMDLNTKDVSPEHDFFKHPKWMVKHGDKYYYNPALPAVQEHLTEVVEEVVKKYDIDAIHFDDYFYPYRIEGKEFNDKIAFEKYGKGMKLADWRRQNVHTFIEMISKMIQKNKPWVQFGISPFGVWRNKSVDPKGSDTQAGQTNYDDLFADPMVWMENKWIDYLLPQLYWSQQHPKASHSKLLHWWADNTNKNTALYIGNSSYKIKADSDKNWNKPNEIPNQIEEARLYKNIQGNVIFSAKYFMQNKLPEVTSILLNNQYKYPALPNVVPRLKDKVDEKPQINFVESNKNQIDLLLQKVTKNKIRYVVVYGGIDEVDPTKASFLLDKIAIETNADGSIPLQIQSEIAAQNTHFALTFIDFKGNESAATYFKKSECISLNSFPVNGKK